MQHHQAGSWRVRGVRESGSGGRVGEVFVLLAGGDAGFEAARGFRARHAWSWEVADELARDACVLECVSWEAFAASQGGVGARLRVRGVLMVSSVRNRGQSLMSGEVAERCIVATIDILEDFPRFGVEFVAGAHGGSMYARTYLKVRCVGLKP